MQVQAHLGVVFEAAGGEDWQVGVGLEAVDRPHVIPMQQLHQPPTALGPQEDVPAVRPRHHVLAPRAEEVHLQ